MDATHGAERKREKTMTKQIGTVMHYGRRMPAEKWSNGQVFVLIGLHWYRQIGQAHTFVAA